MMETLNVLQLGLRPAEGTIALPIARCLGKAPNVRLHVLSKDPRSIVRFSRYVSSFHVLQDEERLDEAMSDVCDVVERTGAKAILPTANPSARFISANQDVLSRFLAVPPSPTLDEYNMVADKWLLANYLAEQKLCYLPTVLCTVDETFEQGLRGLSFPVLLKPREDSTRGRGIKRFETADQLQGYLEDKPEHFGRYIVQSYIRGYDVGCNMLCQDGRVLAYTVHKACVSGAEPYAPADVIEYVEDERVIDLATRLVSALRWNGLANIDLRYDEESGQVHVLEFNPRYWASLLGGLSVGINFPYLHCLAGLGVTFPRPAYVKKRFVVKRPLSLYLAQSRRGGFRRGFTLGETTLRYRIADPLPSAVTLANRGWQAMQRRLLPAPEEG